MAKRIVWLMVSSLMALSLVMVSCGPEEEAAKEEPVKEEPAQKEPAKEEPAQKEPVQKEAVPWWDEMFGEPKYGGTIYLQRSGDLTRFDPWFGGYELFGGETLGGPNPASPTLELQRTYKAMASAIGPENVPWLAESWEVVDPLTTIFHLRQGVHWQNIPPVNGRELTAYDVEYHYARIMGWDGKYGFTQKTPWVPTTPFLNIASITATDKYTLVYKFKEEARENKWGVNGMGMADKLVCAPEAIKLWGNVNDWRHSIGTGAYIIDDYVTASCITCVKNPDYWRYDPRHPENKLPYADVIKWMVIPDASTARSALRTGKIDMLINVSWEEAAPLKETNPSLILEPFLGEGGGVNFNCQNKPFTDIRVRRAFQMAMDLKTLAETLRGGLVDGTPVGIISLYYPNQMVPYAEWPQELKDEYAYNPAGAKALLKEAGYPDGFKTNCVASSGSDLTQLLVIKAWLLDIGVDMEIKVMDPASYSAFVNTGKYDQMNYSGLTTTGLVPRTAFSRDYYPHAYNLCNNQDPVFNKMYEEQYASKTDEEADRLIKEMYLYDLAHHWRIYTQPKPSFYIHQPWFKGYTCEYLFDNHYGFWAMHWWIDQDLKKSLGY